MESRGYDGEINVIMPKINHSVKFNVFAVIYVVITTAMLLCQMSIRRWIPDNRNKERPPFLTNAVNSHIKISEGKYCLVPIVYGYAAKQPVWKEQDEECYNIWGYEQLPSAEAVVKNPAGIRGKNSPSL